MFLFAGMLCQKAQLDVLWTVGIMNCVLCEQSVNNGEPTAVLWSKGCESINAASKILRLDITVHPGQTVHRVCRRNPCHHKDVRRSNRQITPSEGRTLKSPGNCFSFNKQCLSVERLSVLMEVIKELTFILLWHSTFRIQIEALCTQRGDEWAELVRGRLQFVHELPAVDAVYHQVWNVNFRTG